MFKQASRLKLRFQTTRGPLSTEQLWDLSLTNLDSLAVSLKQEYDQSGKKSYLSAKTSKDKAIKLRFDIVLSILSDKVEERDTAASAAEDKTHNQEILGIIKNKQSEELQGKSVKELQSLLK